MKRIEKARRRPLLGTEACSVSMLKKTASPGSSSHPMMGKALRSASMSGRSVSAPSGNHLAFPSMNVRGISHGPRCEPATNSSVADRGTGSTGIHTLQVWLPSML